MLQTSKAFIRRSMALAGLFRAGGRAIELALGRHQRDNFVRTPPSPQNAVDIFRGQWWSTFPAEYFVHTDGPYQQPFCDKIVSWGLNNLGGVNNAKVLELGPLEGGHTFMLEQAGAREIVAVEANTQAFLRCLVTKEVCGLSRSRFLCGDLELYLQQCTDRFDLVVCAGVLYHLTDPLKALRAIAGITDRLHLSTHYYDPDVCRTNPEHGSRFAGTVELIDGDLRVTAHRFEYLHALRSRRFMGGTRRESRWLEKEDLFRLLRELGFNDLQSGFDDKKHPNGASIVISAQRS
jgi:SAM-dependent methyltransferase